MSASLNEHISYLTDVRRSALFQAAISDAVSRGDVVADIGCGSGFLGLLCLKAGAAKVFGIDSTEMSEAARETMRRSGFADRYVCIRENSLRTILPEPVDLIVCDHVGFFGFDYGIVHTIQDARHRFLKPTGRIMPASLRLFVAPVQSQTAWAKATAWEAQGVPHEYHWLRNHSVNVKYPVALDSDELLGPVGSLGELDLSLDHPEFLHFETKLEVARNGTLHGIAGFFHCTLGGDIAMTNSPLSDGHINREQAFLPLQSSIEVRTGDRLDVSINARPRENILAWTITHQHSGLRMAQSTLHSMLLSREDVGRVRPDKSLRLKETARARRTVLDYCDGKRTAGQIEELVLAEHPHLFPSAYEIRSFVTDVLRKDSE